ncbi:MAG: ABC transporter ATP-binding protein [Bacteroidetes bacterium]|jgi:ABC-type multidrug transport system ATPase subunit|nr:ABC transporter ATP-binding protein [Bacteroidota bacterium]
MPIKIIIDNVSKRFKRDWIVKQLSFTVAQGDKIAILGKNGSGKSTLLKMICGFVSESEGKINWALEGDQLDLTEWHQHYTLSAPYLELIEEFTLQESIDFHFSLKPKRSDVSIDEALTESGLAPHLSKLISNFSSGMKQRLKLILALCSEASVYLLDEPCSNLDDQGIAWYQSLIGFLPKGKTVIVASNNKDEYAFCDRQISVASGVI